MSMMPLLVLLGVLGLAFGSFANVVIWRYPRGESLSSPGSHCPACDHPVRWYDNVPVVSWLLLRAKCRDCGGAIAPRYPLVELLSGALWVLAGVLYGSTWRTLAAVVLFYLLLLLTFIDLDTMRLPNPIVAMLGGGGLLFAVLSQLGVADMLPLTPGGGPLTSPLLAAIAGIVSGGGLSLGIATAYQGVRGRAGFGMGDVKLMAAFGPYLGAYTLAVLFLGSALGAVWGVAGVVTGKKDLATRFPFGPFLAVAAVVVAAFGPQIWGWYLALALGS